MSSEEGSTLFRRARDGSPEAINALFERYGGRLHALIRARLGPNLRRRLESRDILQATLLKGFQGIDRFEGSGSRSLMAWLGTVAQAEIRDQADFHQRQKRDYARETGLDSKADRVAETIRSEVSRLQLQEDAERMERGLDALSESHREVILLRSFEELTFREIGERLDKSPDACRMLYARALTALTLEMRAI
jgi:RNA polymerase sigma-70 factor (ECF subfamily)